MSNLLMRIVSITLILLIMALVFTVVIPLVTTYTLDQDNDPTLSISSTDEISNSSIPSSLGIHRLINDYRRPDAG